MSEVQRLAALVTKLQGDVASLARERRLASASMEGGAVNVYQPGTRGRPGVALGQQYDGTYAPVPLGGPAPATPSAPSAQGGVERLLVRWDGTFAAGLLTVAPQDWSRAEVHVSTSPTPGVLFETLRGAIESPRGGEVSVTGLIPDTDYWTWLVARSQSGKFSQPSQVVGPVRTTRLTVENIDTAGIGGNIVYRGDTAPAAPSGGHKVGDLWLQTPDNVAYRWEGDPGAWVQVENARISRAIADAFAAQQAADQAGADALAAQTTANGKITTYYQPGAPAGAATGDLWLDTDDGNRLSRWSGTAWVAVQDAAIQTALANAGTAQATADAKVRIFAQAAAPTGMAPGDVGDLWIETDAGNRMWTWSGTAWTSRQLGNSAIQPASLVASDVVATGTVSAALLEAVLVLASTIIAGSPAGQHVRLDGQGLRVMQPDANGDGVPDEAIRLGTQTGDRLGILRDGALVASMDNTGAASFRAVSTQEWPTVGAPDYTGQGGRLDTILDRRPRGMVAWGGQYTDAPDCVDTAGIGIFEIGARLQEGRMYRIQTSALRLASTSATNRAAIQVRYESAPAGSPVPSPTINSPIAGQSQRTTSDPNAETITLSKLFGLNGTPGNWLDFRFLLTYRMWGTGNIVIKAGGPEPDVIELWVEDVGPYTGNLQQTNWGGGVSTIAAPPPPTAPPPQSGSLIRAASWVQSFRQDGSLRADNGGDAFQGYGDSYNGNQQSLIGFPDLTGELAGATITGVGLYLYAERWWYGGGGTAAIGRHSYLNPPGVLGPDRVDAMAMEPFARAQGRWVDLFAHSPQGWAQGTIRGIVLGFSGAGTNPEYYGRFSGAGAGANLEPVIHISYIK